MFLPAPPPPPAKELRIEGTTEEEEDDDEIPPPVSFCLPPTGKGTPSSSWETFIKFQLLCGIPLFAVFFNMRAMVIIFPREDYLYHLALGFLSFAHIYVFRRETYLLWKRRGG